MHSLKGKEHSLRDAVGALTFNGITFNVALVMPYVTLTE